MVRSNKKAFTLVELMVASTIGAFIAMVAVGSLRAITTSAEMVDSHVTAAAEVRFAATLIGQDLANFYRADDPNGTRFIGLSRESGATRESNVIFYTVGRTKARPDQPEGDIYEVEYHLVRNQDQSVLVRRLWPNPNKEFDPGGVVTVIAEDIELFEMRYFDGQEWTNEWPEEMQTTPALVEVTIVGKPRNQREPAIEFMTVNFARAAATQAATSATDQGQQGEQGQQGGGGSTEQGQTSPQGGGQGTSGGNSGGSGGGPGGR